MQASRQWVPPGGTLGEILAETRARLASIEVPAGTPVLRSDRASLHAALRGRNVAVIAEVKRRSPSKGALNPSLSAADQAVRFERGGAAAISVLTEPSRFGGSPADLTEVARVTGLPLLKKDFHVSQVQVLEAAKTPASAILLIARALPPDDLSIMMGTARDVGLEAVVEVRTESELETALAIGASIIGVNARDLETLQVDERVPERLLPTIPSDVVAIWESGVSSTSDVERAAAAGADAVLVGSVLSVSHNAESVVDSFVRVPRRNRG